MKYMGKIMGLCSALMRMAKRDLLLGALMLSATGVFAQESDLKKIHDVLNTVEQKYMKKVKVAPGAVTITIQYIQQLDNPDGNMFHDDMEDVHFPLALFSSETDYSNPFPGFPNKPSYAYTLTISQQAVTLHLKDHDIMLHGDLDSQGNDKIPANPFKRAWGCNGGSETFLGGMWLANRKTVRVNASNTCSHSHSALHRSMQGSGQKANGKWTTTHGGTDYYPAHKFNHDQTTTYSMQSIIKESGYSRDRFIYELLSGGLYYIMTNKQNGNLVLQENDRLCTIYAAWKVFGMTDEKYTALFNSLTTQNSPESQSLDAKYKEAMSLYKAGQYQQAHELYSVLRDAYEKKTQGDIIYSDYTFYMSRVMSSTYRKAYCVIKPKGASHQQAAAALADADTMIQRYNKLFSGIPEFYNNSAELLVANNEKLLARNCYIKVRDEVQKMGDDATVGQYRSMLDGVLTAAVLEEEMVQQGIMKPEQYYAMQYLTSNDGHRSYNDMWGKLPDTALRKYYDNRWYDTWVIVNCVRQDTDEIYSSLRELLYRFHDSNNNYHVDWLPQYKCYPIIKERYLDILKKVVEEMKKYA